MPKKKKESTQSSENISIGNISGGVGFSIGKGAQTTVTNALYTDKDPIQITFKTIRQTITELPDGPHRDTATSIVKQLENEAYSGDQADETKIQQWIDFLADIAPDVWEVVVDTLSNPIKGIAVVFKKVAERANKHKDTTNEKQ